MIYFCGYKALSYQEISNPQDPGAYKEVLALCTGYWLATGQVLKKKDLGKDRRSGLPRGQEEGCFNWRGPHRKLRNESYFYESHIHDKR